ncbi:glucosyltransferase domain-containing protein [Dyella silvatica]|uniref:glucosyltransferase domain-containing protein n=1 Tax=Dyella silvatica TaxID=2992128 RepID=UPI00224FBEFE|nr:glucosyltransferase domain-containing protein [Dyella silvatica]
MNRKSLFGALFTVYLLFVLYPILRADRYCNDDLMRVLWGPYIWVDNGRPLSALLMRALEFNATQLVDISPLPQIAAIAILAWLGVLIAEHYAIRSLSLAVMVTLPLGAQPFFLENLSYRFDALPMALSLLFALLPITAPNPNRRWWLGSLSLFACLCFYQPAINAFLVFVCLDIAVAQIHGVHPRELLIRLLSRGAQLGLAMAVYQLTVAPFIIGWVKAHSLMIHSPQQLSIVRTNVSMFYGYLFDAFDTSWLHIFAPLAVLALLIPVVIGVRYALSARHEHPLLLTAALLLGSGLLPLAAMLCVAGPMLLTLELLVVPRVLVGIGALLSAALIAMGVALHTWRASPRWSIGIAGIWTLGMLVFANVYGNALGSQKQFEDRIGAGLVDDLAQAKAAYGLHRLLLDGTNGLSPVAAHALRHRPGRHSLADRFQPYCRATVGASLQTACAAYPQQLRTTRGRRYRGGDFSSRSPAGMYIDDASDSLNPPHCRAHARSSGPIKRLRCARRAR